MPSRGPKRGWKSLRGPLQKGTETKVAHNGAEIGRKCYVTPAFSGVLNPGKKVKGGPEVGRSAM